MSEFEQAFTILDARVDAEVFDLLRHVVLELNRVDSEHDSEGYATQERDELIAYLYASSTTRPS